MTRTTRTRPTNSTRSPQHNQADGGESPFSFSADQELPDGLRRVGNTPFYNTPPQIETNECGQIHPSLSYFCDIDLQAPTSFAEPKYEISINGCGVCITMVQNYSATETASQTYCYVLPTCRRRPETPPQELPIDFDFFDKLIRGVAPGCFATLFFGTHAIHKYYGFTLIEASSNPGYSPWFTNFSTYTDSFGNFSMAQYEFSYFTRRIQSDGNVIWHYSLLAMLRVAKQRNGTVVYYEPDKATNGLWPTGPINSIQDFLNRARFHDDMQAAWGFPKHNWGFEGLQLSCSVGEKYWPLPSPPPYPSPQPRDRDMNCCADVRRLIQMVAMLQKEVSQIKRRTGVDEFPVSVPQLL
ncbi:hypothetical protein, partial [Microseira wollei]|uniref:hypothetical protein n=1 Tax=Microseira wollei TaxID=467598 RepID=UPI001CFD089E